MLGILLCAFSLRSAVASLSPVIDHISGDFPLPPAVIGLIGTAPPVCFAIFGLLTPLLERRFGLERLASWRSPPPRSDSCCAGCRLTPSRCC